MIPTSSINWDQLDAGKFAPEADCVAALLKANPLSLSDRTAIRIKATELVRATRASAQKQGVVEGFLKEFSLGTREGLALMCLGRLFALPSKPLTIDRFGSSARISQKASS